MRENFIACPETFGTCPELFGIRFDEGGTDSIQIIIIFTEINRSVLSGSTLLGKVKESAKVMDKEEVK